MADFKPKPREKNALDNRKLNLSAPTPGVQGKYASLIWGLYSNAPRITIYTNDPNDNKDYGKITANMSLPVWEGLMSLIEKAANFKPSDSAAEFKEHINNMNFIFPGGKRSEKPVQVSQTFVGKDKDGMVWISVVAKDRPRIKFVWKRDDFHEFVHGDGTPYTDSEMSVLAALGYVRTLRQMMTHLAAENYVEPPPKDGQRGGGGGNRGGGGYGGGRRDDAGEGATGDGGDDMPW